MSFNRYLLVVVALLLSPTSVVAQVYTYTQYQIDDGLASNEAYSVVQDTQGFIWVSTDKGITQYDGHEFKTYGIAEGLSSTSSYKILASPLGGIIFYTADNQVGKISNDSISYFFDDNSTAILSIAPCKKGFVISYREESKFEIYSWEGEKLEEKSFPFGFYFLEIDEITATAIGNLTTSVDTINYIKSTGVALPLGPSDKLASTSISFSSYKDLKIIASDSGFFSINSNDSLNYTKLSGQVTSASLVDSRGRLWLGTFGQGVKVFSLKKGRLLFNLLSGFSISSICEDKEGNIWLTTLKNGLFNLNKNYYKPLAKGSIKKLVDFNGQLVSIFNDSSLLLYQYSSKKIDTLKLGITIKDLLVTEDTLFVSLTGLSKVSPNSLSPDIKLLCMSSSKLTTYQNKVIGINQNRLFTRNENEITKPQQIKIQLIEIGRGYTYFLDNVNNTIYLGCINGLYKLHKIHTANGKILAKKLTSTPITCANLSSPDYIFGTKGHGLLVSSPNFLFSKHFTTSTGLNGNFVSSLTLRNDSLFCGTEKGVNLLTDISDSNKTRITDISNGLWSKNTSSLLLKNQELYVGTDKGIQKISLPSIEHIPNPKPYIAYLNEHRVTLSDSVVVQAGTNNIKIGLNTIFFHDHSYEREYRLLGRDSNWVSTVSKEIEFVDLPPGHYKFEFRTKLYNNSTYSTSNLNFELLPLFHQTSWFKIGLGLLICLLIIGVAFIRERYLREKTNLILFQEQMRYRALTAQLNPHFIFNALGSIQNLIITKKNELAAEYLASFSNLLDKTLNNTSYLFIPLADEMSFIDKYIDVERSRFEKPFEFKWHIGAEVNRSTFLVPTMFLQPYVENSIIHGINPLKTLGKVDISIRKLKENVLEIKIVDNGVGIKQSKTSKNKNTRKSMAMNNIEARMRIMKKLYKNNYHQSIKDLSQSDGTILGTEVIIQIPYKQD